jgi:hypothetical protein
MASTYSDLKIELIGTGEQTGTWGTTTNDNFSIAIGEAITGSADVAFSSADVTLTLTNTNASQAARNLRLNLTGTSGGARQLILGSGCQIDKLYLINNGLADAVTVKNTSGTGIAVPAGKSMFVFNNGTNVVEAVNSAVTLDVTTLDATNIEVTNIKAKDGTASATIADSTGIFTHSTATVFTAGTVSAPAITTTGDTNTGIFFPAADTIAFTEGGVESMRIDSSGNVSVAGSTATFAPASSGLNCYYETDSGIGTLSSYSTGGATLLTFHTSGSGGTTSERMRIDSSGNVGIGTSSPAVKLDVNGVINNNTGVTFSTQTNTGTAYSAGIQLGTVAKATGPTGGQGALSIVSNDASNQLQGFVSLVTDATAANRRLLIGVIEQGVAFRNITLAESGGNVGIGTSSPQAKLHVANSSSGLLFSEDGSKAVIIGTNAAGTVSQELFLRGDPLTFTGSGGGGAEHMRLNSDGNLGIGTTSPSTYGASVKLAVVSTGVTQSWVVGGVSSGAYAFYSNNNQSATTNAFQLGQGWASGTDNIGFVNTLGANPFLIATNGTERMRITSAGNVGIGNSTPDFLLEVKSNNTANQGLKIWGASPDGTKNSNIYFGDNAGTNAYVMRFVNVFGGGSGEAYGLNLRSLNTSADFTVVAGTEGSPITGLTLKGNSGNVGIGTASPASYGASRLAVVGGELGLSNTSDARFYLYTGTTVRGLLYADATRIQLEASGTNPLTLWTNSGERVRIDSSGNLLVGQTATINSERLCVRQSSSANTTGIVVGYGTTAGQFRSMSIISTDVMTFNNGSNEASLSAAGAWTNASDARLKNSIVDIKYGLETVLNTQPRSYKMNNLEGDYIGFVAQELQTVIPEVVSGNPETQLGVDYGSLVAVAFKAIQELKATVDAQAARIAALESK